MAPGPHRGGTGVQITKAKPAPTTPRKERHNAVGVSVSPDGKYLYYAVRQGPFSYNVQLPLWKIVRRDRKTGDEDEIIAQQDSAFDIELQYQLQVARPQ